MRTTTDAERRRLVHNHGPDEGPGFGCEERRIGACVEGAVFGALRRIADEGCEHYVMPHRCADQPGAFSDDAEFWADRTCNPCLALKALRAAGVLP